MNIVQLLFLAAVAMLCLAFLAIVPWTIFWIVLGAFLLVYVVGILR